MSEANYRVGIYCRLSKDDAGEGESSSISTPKSILIDYCTVNNLNIYDIYVDDGYSGLNFNRPGFQEMMANAEAGHINKNNCPVRTMTVTRRNRTAMCHTQTVRYIAKITT